jgi:hypothetical protein
MRLNGKGVLMPTTTRFVVYEKNEAGIELILDIQERNEETMFRPSGGFVSDCAEFLERHIREGNKIEIVHINREGENCDGR